MAQIASGFNEPVKKPTFIDSGRSDWDEIGAEISGYFTAGTLFQDVPLGKCRVGKC